jgi:hypothetical protein
MIMWMNTWSNLPFEEFWELKKLLLHATFAHFDGQLHEWCTLQQIYYLCSTTHHDYVTDCTNVVKAY